MSPKCICGKGFDFIQCVQGRCYKHLQAGEWHGQTCVFRKITVTGVKKMVEALAWKEALVGGDRGSDQRSQDGD